MDGRSFFVVVDYFSGIGSFSLLDYEVDRLTLSLDSLDLAETNYPEF